MGENQTSPASVPTTLPPATHIKPLNTTLPKSNLGKNEATGVFLDQLLPSVEFQTSFRRPEPDSPPITHILLSKDNAPKLCLCPKAAGEGAEVQIIPSAEDHTAPSNAELAPIPPKTHVLL